MRKPRPAAAQHLVRASSRGRENLVRAFAQLRVQASLMGARGKRCSSGKRRRSGARQRRCCCAARVPHESPARVKTGAHSQQPGPSARFAHEGRKQHPAHPQRGERAAGRETYKSVAGVDRSHERVFCLHPQHVGELVDVQLGSDSRHHTLRHSCRGRQNVGVLVRPLYR